MRPNEKGFTLMELMVVIVIVAILAAVAVPLYINYVNDARRTEAKGAIGAVVTAEQTFFQSNNYYIPYTNAEFTVTPVPPAPVLKCDLTDVLQNWTVDVTDASATGFTVTATSIAVTDAKGVLLKQVLEFSRTDPPIWTPE